MIGRPQVRSTIGVLKYSASFADETAPDLVGNLLSSGLVFCSVPWSRRACSTVPRLVVTVQLLWLVGCGERPRYVQGHQGDGPVDRTKPVRRVFRNDHKIALRDSLLRAAFDASPGEIFRVGTGFFHQLASRH